MPRPISNARLLRSIRPKGRAPKLKPPPRAATVTLKLDGPVIAQLDGIAERRGVTRDEAARDVLCRGLNAMALAATRR